MDYFECCICCERFEDPRVLPCGHTSCFKCLKNLKPQELNCPLCRNPFNSVDSLPKNFVILQWMSSINQNEPKPPIHCDNCDPNNAKVAVIWCKACDANFCEDCDGGIHSSRALKRHERVKMKDKARKIESCLSHFEEKKIFCSSCKVFVCGICVVDHHKNHDTMSVFKYSDGLKDTLKEMVKGLVEKKDLVEDIERDLDDQIRKKGDQIEGLRVELRKLEEELKTMEGEKKSCVEVIQKSETTHLVLLKLIEDLSLADLTNQHNMDLIKQRIQEVLKQVYPELLINKIQKHKVQKEEKERLEKERLEKESLEKERLEKERLEKDRLEKDRLEKDRFKRERLEKEKLEWWDRSDNLGGVRQSTFNPNVYYFVSKSNQYDKTKVFQPPPGFRWMSTQEGANIFIKNPNTSGTYVYKGQGGWSGYTWQGVDRYCFIFSDTATTNAFKHAGNYDESAINYGVSPSRLAGIVCWKI